MLMYKSYDKKKKKNFLLWPELFYGHQMKLPMYFYVSLFF